MTPSQPRPKACHNCRRQRLKCDRTHPFCLKCTTRGQQCLGYQRLFRWEQGVASRGKMVGIRFDEVTKGQMFHSISSSQSRSYGTTGVSPITILTDPIMQDLTPSSRKYIFYFASDVCRNLVLYDVPEHNPFRELIPLIHQNPILRHIIIANSALHMSNASQKCVDSEAISRPYTNFGSSKTSVGQLSISYNDALAAKQRALCLLKYAITSIASVDVDVTLAVVLLFIEFELLDSGRNDWKYHINGARTIIERLCGPDLSTQTTMTPLRRCLVSNWLVFDIHGSTLTSSNYLVPGDTNSAVARSLLQDAEGNHCSSFPAILLQLIRAAAQLSLTENQVSSQCERTIPEQRRAHSLLEEAQSFDPLTWAVQLQARSPVADVEHRTHVASAHRAAVCIYLSRIMISLDSPARVHDHEVLVKEVIHHLSFIRPTDALFTATTWPAFIAGAETINSGSHDWVRKRFQELWEVEPWGLMPGALGVLERIWAERGRIVVDEDEARVQKKTLGPDWIQDLKRRGIDWLIL